MSMASSERSLASSDTGRVLSNSIHRLRRRTQAHATPENVALFLVAFRILNALALRTFFQPDEFFQSLEPAWQAAFGPESGAWITWEWKNQLRSSIHPLIFTTIYYIAGLIAWLLPLPPLTAADLLVAAPKAAQAVIAAVGDYYTWRLAGKVYGDESDRAWATLALAVLSPWQWFCSTRTLSNCLEATLTVVALYLWPWEWCLGKTEEGDAAPEDESRRTGESLETASRLSRYRWPGLNGDIFTMMFLTVALSSLRKSLLLAALACVLRPTNILVWMCLAGFAVYNTPRSTYLIIIREAVVCGSSVLGVSIVADRFYYGLWTFPPLKFLYFNIAQSLAVFYGRNDWHYYLSQGLPLLLTTALPFALVGLYDTWRPSGTKVDRRVAIKQQLAAVCLFMPLVLSLIAHKEVRFIYPLLPALHVLAAEPLVSFFRPAISSSSSAYMPRRLVLIFLLLVNVVIAYYTTITHASGPLNVLAHLRQRHQAHQGPSYALEAPHPLFGSFTTPQGGSSKTMTVGFLMPCHSTPWRSHLVFPSIEAWALSCEPPIGLNETQKLVYLDEADQFYQNPTDFLQHHMVGGLRHIPRTPSYLSVPRAPTTYFAPPPKDASLHEWPDYLIFFAQLEPTLHAALRSSSYGECWRTWNTAWHDDWRRRGDIVVWCLDPTEQSEWHKTQHHKHRAQRDRQFDRIISGMVKKAKKNQNPTTSNRLWGIASYIQKKPSSSSSSSSSPPWYSSLWPFSSSSSFSSSSPRPPSSPPPSWLTSWMHLLPGAKPKKKYPYLPEFLQRKKDTEPSAFAFWTSWWPSKKSKEASSSSSSSSSSSTTTTSSSSSLDGIPGYVDRELWA